MKAQWALLSITIAAATMIVAACGSTSTNEPDGEGGAAGAGAASPGGTAGATQPGGCTQHADCKSFGDCDTLDVLEADCQLGRGDLVRYASRCGGTYVEETGAVTLSTWVFDANGKLIGAAYEDEGTCSYWGSTCGRIGPGEPFCSHECSTPLCGIGGEGGMGGQGGAGAGGGAGGGAAASGSD